MVPVRACFKQLTHESKLVIQMESSFLSFEKIRGFFKMQPDKRLSNFLSDNPTAGNNRGYSF